MARGPNETSIARAPAIYAGLDRFGRVEGSALAERGVERRPVAGGVRLRPGLEPQLAAESQRFVESLRLALQLRRRAPAAVRCERMNSVPLTMRNVTHPTWPLCRVRSGHCDSD